MLGREGFYTKYLRPKSWAYRAYIRMQAAEQTYNKMEPVIDELGKEEREMIQKELMRRYDTWERVPDHLADNIIGWFHTRISV